MTKRNVATLIVVIIAAAIGGLIGFVWHAPGRSSTWADARDWATTAAIVLGFPAAVYQLNLQRRQFADEVDRNVERDKLIAGQLHDLDQRERLRNREQAEGIDLQWSPNDDQGSTAQVTNRSRRPIRDVVCRLDPGHGEPHCSPVRVRSESRTGGSSGDPTRMHGVTDEWRVTNIRFSETFGFDYGVGRSYDPCCRMLVRFTDDADLHWELDHRMHLTKIDDRDW